jgi:hypothetical protein
VAGRSTLTTIGTQTLAIALGRSHRSDPVVGETGGPAGNARLTAWTGLLLLLLFLAEGVTLLDVRGLISWHLAIGVALVPPSLLKTGSTGWRIARYYGGSRPYREAGPPHMVVRLLGPVVVLSTLAVLGTGVVLVLIGAPESRQTLLSPFGQRVDAITFHQAAFVVWVGVTGAHVLTRLIPAWQLVRPGAARIPSAGARVAALAAALVLCLGCAGWVVAHPNGWRSGDLRPPAGQGPHER